MERTKQKSKKDKPNKVVDKGKSSSFITDVKLFKENLKIREILRTVKMNSSMRIKAPRGSKVMQHKDFIENEDLFEETLSDDGQNGVVPPSATNTVLNTEIHDNLVPEEEHENNEDNSNTDVVETKFSENYKIEVEASAIYKCKSLSEGLEDRAEFGGQLDTTDSISDSLPAENPVGRSRDRKLSLDHTILSRREGLSQSEVDLHAIGKLPLERKSSFFRKKMDSFLKNTTEIFKRQSLGSKSGPSPLAQRRGSNSSRISVSLQSLNENSAYNGEFDSKLIHKCHDQQGSVTSLLSSVTPVRSNSTVSVAASDRPPEMSEEDSLADSRQELVGSQPLPDVSSLGIPYLDIDYMQDSLLSSRASSMSSGLDTATGQRRRKTSRSNRVSWLASESLTDYFRRLIQDEKGQETQEAHHSYQDFSAIPENKYGPRPDSKGRRLSYVRAVSREDPVLPSRSQDSSLRRKKIPEYEVNVPEVHTLLAEFSETGIPPLAGFTELTISEDATRFLEVLGSDDYAIQLKELDWGPAFEPFEPNIDAGASKEKGSSAQPRADINAVDNMRHEVLKELICTEAVHIRYLKIIVQVYVAAAHKLQSEGALGDVNTSILFVNIPDILNANISFWEQAIYPMLEHARKTRSFFDTSLMIAGLKRFAETFEPYDEYMENQAAAVEYMRSTLNFDQEFITYLSWCDMQTGHRLQLSDMLIKPLQRLTKYTLITSRLIQYSTNDDKKQELVIAENIIKAFIISVNRSCRQKEELDILMKLKIEPYEPDFKGDEEIEQTYKTLSVLNLFIPMVGCVHYTLRSLIHQGNLRYKDYLKEFDARVFLFTDMILICKKVHKSPKSANRWKMQRPKVLLHRTVPGTKQAKSLDATTLVYVILDEQGCAQGTFQLSVTSKDPNPMKTIKVWEMKINEAMICYTLTKWYCKYPVEDLAIIEKDYSVDPIKKHHPDRFLAEKKARERVAAMLHPSKRLTIPDPGMEICIPLNSYECDKGPMELHSIFNAGQQNLNAWQSRAANFRTQPKGLGSYSFASVDVYVSMSGSSHEDVPHTLTLQQSDSSAEQYIPPLVYYDDFHISPSVTVNLSSDRSQQPSPPTLVLQQSSPNLSPGPRSASAGAAGSENTLHVISPIHSTGHSLPDINAEFHRAPNQPVIVQSASAKMYRSHQELMQRNRLAASQQLLGPDHRLCSYPPPSPTRPLTRGLAFSYSFIGHAHTTPPLRRSRNISTSPQNAPKDLLTDIKRLLRLKSPVRSDPPKVASRQRSPSPSTSTFKPDVKTSSTSADTPTITKKTSVQRRFEWAAHGWEGVEDI